MPARMSYDAVDVHWAQSMTTQPGRALLRSFLIVISLVGAFALGFLLLPSAGWELITPHWKSIAAIGAGVHAVSVLIALHRAGDLHGIVIVAIQLLGVGGLLFSALHGLLGFPGNSLVDAAALHVAGWALVFTSWRMALVYGRARRSVPG